MGRRGACTPARRWIRAVLPHPGPPSTATDFPRRAGSSSAGGSRAEPQARPSSSARSGSSRRARASPSSGASRSQWLTKSPAGRPAARAASSAHSGRAKARSRAGAAHTASTKSALAARRASPEPRRLGRRRALVRGRTRVRRYWPPPRISASARSPTARLSFCRSSRPDSRQGRVRPAWSTTACRFMTPTTRTVRRLDWFMGILPRFRAHCSRAGRAEATAKTVPQKSCAGACFAPAQDYGSSRPRRPRVRIRWMLFGARK